MRYLIFGLLMILALAFFTWGFGTSARSVVEGEVIGKREAFEMPGGDRWRHLYEITYRYQPAGAPYPATGQHGVDPSLYRRLRVGSRVSVRYGPQRFLGVPFGLQSFLTESSWLSRIPYESGFTRESVEMAALAVIALMGFLAHRTKSRSMGLVAAFAGGIWVSSILLAGFLVFPILFWIWRRNPGKGYGWLFLATMASTTAVLYWRVPQPTPMPPGPTRDAVGVVHHIKTVAELWTSDEGGQDIRRPFQMLDVEFKPEGAQEAVHFLDRVDQDSVPGLREGAKAPVLYAASDPSVARIAGGTRTYAEKALMYLLGLTYGLGAVIAFVVCPVIFAADRVFNRYRRWVMGVPFDDVARKMSGLPEDDPRRVALEKLLRSQRDKKRQIGKEN